MELSTLHYAQKNLDIVAQENGFTTDLLKGKLYIEMPSGRSFELSEDEIKYQAIEYLQGQISDIKNS
jgi:hypothetical protein